MRTIESAPNWFKKKKLDNLLCSRKPLYTIASSAQMGQPLIRNEYKRSGLKAVTWRVLATLTTMSIVYVYTGEIDLMVGVGILDVLLKMALYFVHERIWNNVALGRTVKEDPKFGLAFGTLRDMENLMG